MEDGDFGKFFPTKIFQLLSLTNYMQITIIPRKRLVLLMSVHLVRNRSWKAFFKNQLSNYTNDRFLIEHGGNHPNFPIFLIALSNYTHAEPMCIWGKFGS